jgi:sugar lactone lactonase YvrE
MYYTNDTTHKVACCDINGKVQWEFCDENVLVLPKGITTDNNNNIYVVSTRSNSVVVISPDGQNYKVLLSDRDVLSFPRTIHCDRASNQLLLAHTGGTGLLYDISTTPT